MRADAEANRTHIIDAYLDYLTEHRRAPTMEDVAATARLTRGTVYRHFGDRDALRQAALARVLDSAEDLFGDALAAPEPINAALVAIVERGSLLLRQVQALSTGQDHDDTRLLQRWHRFMRPLVQAVADAQARGELRPDLPATWLAETLLWLTHAMSSRVDLGLRQTRTEIVLATFLDGARPPRDG